MHYKELIEETEPRFKKILSGFKKELAKIRTHRPSTELVEDLEVNCFGKKMPLKSLGMISLTKEKEIIVKPWDDSYLEPIEKAIYKSSLNLSPVVEEERIRIPFPSLTKERREEYVRILSGKAEEARKRIREIRNSVRRKIEKTFSKGELSEDDKYRALDELQEEVDQCNEKIEEMRDKKEEQIMS